MLVIKEKNFEMVQTSGPFFDLSILSKVNEGKENEREEMKLFAHGLPFDSCIKQIINHFIDKNKVYSAKEYINEYKKAVDKIEKLIVELDTKEQCQEILLGEKPLVTGEEMPI